MVPSYVSILSIDRSDCLLRYFWKIYNHALRARKLMWLLRKSLIARVFRRAYVSIEKFCHGTIRFVLELVWGNYQIMVVLINTQISFFMHTDPWNFAWVCYYFRLKTFLFSCITLLIFKFVIIWVIKIIIIFHDQLSTCL